MEWRGAGVVEKWALKARGIWKAWYYYKSSMNVETALSELCSVIYNCARKSERFNQKINVNFFANECKIMKNYLEDLLEAVNNYSSSEENHELLLISKEKEENIKGW